MNRFQSTPFRVAKTSGSYLAWAPGLGNSLWTVITGKRKITRELVAIVAAINATGGIRTSYKIWLVNGEGQYTMKEGEFATFEETKRVIIDVAGKLMR